MYRGSSKSRLLHNMVLDLRKMAMVGDIIVHFVWISGERMIHQGTDGLSRGDFSSGIMAGEMFLKFLPIHRIVIERFPTMEKEVLDWVGRSKGRSWKIAKTSNRFHEVFQDPKGVDLVSISMHCKGCRRAALHSKTCVPIEPTSIRVPYTLMTGV